MSPVPYGFFAAMIFAIDPELRRRLSAVHLDVLDASGLPVSVVLATRCTAA